MGVHRHHASGGHAVESVCQVLREQGCQVAARTYRAWKPAARRPPPATPVIDAVVVDLLPARVGGYAGEVSTGGGR